MIRLERNREHLVEDRCDAAPVTADAGALMEAIYVFEYVCRHVMYSIHM